MPDRTDAPATKASLAALHASFLALLPQLHAQADFAFRHRRGTGRDDTLSCRCCPLKGR
jgi:hypothetical protein